MTRERILFATEGRRPAGSGLMGSRILDAAIHYEPSAEHDAALAVCAHATGKADAIRLLDMLGLLPGGA